MQLRQSPSQSNAATPLLFGEGDAVLQTDYRVLGDRMNLVYPGVNAYDPIGSPSAFSSKMNTLKLPAMQVVAVVMSPSHIDRSSTQNATLKVPLAGEFNCILEGRPHRCGASLGAMYFPQGSGRAKGSGGDCSQVSFQFEPLQLEKTARAMLGQPVNAALDLQLTNPRVVPMTVAGQEFSTILHHVGALIDLHQRDAKLLTQLGLQDTLYRHIAMLLRPDAFLPPASHPKTTASAALVARLCDYMHANLESGLTLTDLETFCGLSARSLQLSFKRHLGCSPMQWLTQQKLHKIHKILSDADISEPIASLAVAYFPNLGDFARYYRHQFGELPSQTRARQCR
ncbi:MAG: AraC family transcriptional regulator [Methylotenera sp.]|nr:AraC family transcriptional regulator [Methylotenera sp.]